jgi:large repetitive protein
MSKSPRHRRPLIEALEPRLLFSATADITVFDDGNADGVYLTNAAEQLDLLSVYHPVDTQPIGIQSNDDSASNLAPQADLAVTDNSSSVATVIVVDTSIDNYQSLVDDIRDRSDSDSLAIIYLDSLSNGVEQITAALAHYSGVSQLHIISHGSAGALELGSAILTDNSLVQFEDDLLAWGKALSDDADILFYGCDVATNPAGKALIEKIALLTDADVAASEDFTGHASLGGDWDLEYRVGNIESDVLISAEMQQAFVGVMATTHYINIQGGASSQSFSSTFNIGQTFVYDSPGATYTVNQFSVQLKKDPTAEAQDIVLELRSGDYNGTWLANATVNANALSTSFEWVSFNIGDFVLNDNQQYTIRLISTGADGKVSAAYSASNLWNNSELIVNGVADSASDLSLLVSYYDGVNTAPTVANAISDQSTNEESLYSYTVPANTFTDVDGQTLTYTATLANDSPLPAWLSFNAGTRTFSGVPDDGDVGTLSIKVIANDGNGGTVADTFDLTIVNINDLPFVNIPIPNQSATEDSAFTYSFPANTFGDGDLSVSFTYTAELADGNALPGWLSFDSATRTFSGTPANGDVGIISVKVIADDGAGATVSDTFDIAIANTNDAPTVANAIANQVATEDVLFNYTFAINTFNDQDVGDTLTYSAQIPGGIPLPVWLSFDSATRTFSGTPSNGDVGNITIEVIADDGTTTVSDFFDLQINNVGSSNLNYETSGPATDAQSLSSGVPLYQSFLHDSVGATYTIDSIILQLKKDPSASLQTITVTLIESTYNGAVVASQTMTSAALENSLAWEAFDFSGIALNDGQIYFIKVETSSFDGLVSVGIHNTNVYPDGSYHSSTGTPDPDRDLAFQISSGTNNDPVIANPIPNQNATEDSAYSFQFAANTFSDTDGDTLTYSATMAGGGALPAWLSFDAATRTFSGTPANGDVGTISIKVTADDTKGGTPAMDTFDIVIANTNDAPTVANAIPNQNATEDSAFNFTFAANTFTDQDVGNTLTYSAQLAGGGALPAWLSFDAATRTFSGTPTNTYVGTVSIDVIASDGNGGTVTDTFDIVVANTNDAPTVANAIPDQNATEDSAFSFQFAANTFNDVDVGNTLTYSAQLAGGGALPLWLVFDSATRTFSGTPTNSYVGTVSIDVIASDSNGGTVTDTFNITVANTNDAPTVVIGPTDYYADEQVAIDLHGTGISVADVDGDALTITLAAQWSNSNLAATVGTTGVVIVSGVNTKTLILSGTAAQLNDLLAGNNGGTLTYRLSGNTPVATDVVTVTASDGSLTGNDSFTVNITAVNDAPINTVPGAQVTNEDTALVFSSGNSNQIQIDDVDVASADLEITLSVTNGTLTLAGTTGLVFTTGDGTTDSTMVFRGTQADINVALATLTFNPTANYSGGAVLSITTSDLGSTGTGGTLTDTDTINITINSVNDAPTIANAIPNQNATEDSAFSFQFAANTFSDIDVGDTLTYSAQLAGGGALPAWLSFDEATRTFSGTPTNAFVGTVSIDVIADDSNGGTLTDTFDIVVANTNDAPTIANAIADQNATEDSAFSFQFAANTFSDIDVGDTLTYSAQLAGGGALPAWLSFDAATRTFSGTPTNAFVGTVSIDVIADDSNGGTVTDTFDIVVANTNDAPTIANAIADQNATEDSAFSFQFAANTFNDVDAGATLTYSAQLAGGGALPAWLSFDAATRTFSGTPTNAFVGTVSIDVIADDGLGGTVTDTFDIVVANTNDAPTVANAIPDRSAADGVAFNFQFAANTFNDVDVSDTLTYSALLSGGGALPAWLSFDSATRTFSGVPTTSDVGVLSIDVTANDGSGGTVTDTFTLTVTDLPDTEYIDTGGGGAQIPVSSGSQIGQSFSYDSVGASYTVNEISLYLARYTDAALQTITVELRDAWNGAVIASDSISSSAISGDGFNWHSFNFANVSLNDQQTYVIQISSSGNDDKVLVSRIAGDTFADGAMIENGVPDASGWDLAFKIAKDDGLNAAPVLDNPIADQSIDAEVPFNLVVPANTFSDPDPNDTIMYRAQRAGGGSLDWLTFNESTRTFSGTPHWHQAGTMTVELIATDNHGASTSAFFDVEVINTNTAPTVANPIPDQGANEDAAFSFQFAANTFTDVDVGNTFTYSAELAVVGGLPPWLSFDSATRTFSGTPANGDVGTWTIEVAANDGFGGEVIDTFVITVANTNDAPTLANPIPNRAATEDSAFNFQFAANTFADVDVGTVFTYSAQLTSASPLPAWLSFDSATRTFSGTPANADVGTISVEVTADDGAGGTITDMFDIVIANANDAPTVANPISDQNATEDSAFAFQFAVNTFSDADVGDTLTYSAQLASGGALPAWLSFDAATRTFSGTPTNAFVGTVSIDVIANDGNGGTVTETFDIVVANTNDAPTVANAIPDKNATQNSVFNFQFAANTFADMDVDDTLTFSAQLAGGGGLPAWLSFDAVTRTFSGTPANSDIGTISIDVIADDGNGGTVSDTFDLVVAAGVNNLPTVANAIPDQNATEDAVFSFQFAANTFNDTDIANTLTYTAQLSGGAVLPSWLSFDEVTRTFSGTPTNTNVGTIAVEVTADDGHGGTVTDTFDIVIANTNDAPTVANAIPNQNATEDSAFNFQFAANTFNDVDAGDTLTYSAQLAGGGALPAWLSFDSATRTFSGTPTNAFVGTVSIDVIADDGSGGIVTDTFNIVVANTNDAPTVVNAIPNQNATEDAAFNFQFSANTFNDIDAGDALIYSAQLAGGGALPTWLSFDAVTRTFSGIPNAVDVGSLSIEVIASDGQASVVTQFQLTVSQHNDTPRTSGIATINNVEDAAGDLVDLWAAFSDEESAANELMFTVVGNSNPNLVSTATIDAATGKLQLHYGANQFGSADLTIRAQDPQGLFVETKLHINIEPVNDVPTTTGIADIKVKAGAAPQQMDMRNVFSDIEDGTHLQWALMGNSNDSVVTGVQIDPVTGVMTLSFAAKNAGESIVMVRAQDVDGAWVESSFKVTVTAAEVVPPVEPVPPTTPPVTVPPTTPPTTPPTAPPVTEVPTTPPTDIKDVGPIVPVAPDDGTGSLFPGLDGTTLPELVSDIDTIERNDSGSVDNQSSRDFERANDFLKGESVSTNLLNASPSLVSLITPDAGFAPWDEADFASEVRRIRAQMDDAMTEELDQKAMIAGLTFSVTTGLLVWSLRASSLLLTLMSMLPLWRGLDPLPILEEVNKKKKELEQQRKDKLHEDKNAKEVGYLFDHAQRKESGS